MDELAEGRRRFEARIRDGRVRPACAVYAENARLLVPSADPIYGRRAIASYWQAGLDSGMTAIDLAEIEIGRRDGFTYEIGHYAMRLQPADAEPVVDRGTYLFIFEPRGDGRWVRQLEVLTPDGRPLA